MIRTDDNLIANALNCLSLHAIDMQQTAKLLNDSQGEFVWQEVREMLRSLSMLKRSPLLDELNDRISTTKKDSAYYYSRLAAIAAVFMVVKVQSWPRARACRAVGRLTGVDATLLEKKMGLPSDLSDFEQIAAWEHWPDVSAILDSAKTAAARGLDRDPTKKEWFKAVIRIAKSNAQSQEYVEWRRSMIAKAFNLRPREELSKAFLLTSRDMIERVTAEL